MNAIGDKESSKCESMTMQCRHLSEDDAMPPIMLGTALCYIYGYNETLSVTAKKAVHNLGGDIRCAILVRTK